MKNTNLSLLLVMFISLVCISTSSIALAQDGERLPCCFVETEVEPEDLPVIESIPATDLAQDGERLPCCFVETEVEPV